MCVCVCVCRWVVSCPQWAHSTTAIRLHNAPNSITDYWLLLCCPPPPKLPFTLYPPISFPLLQNLLPLLLSHPFLSWSSVNLTLPPSSFHLCRPPLTCSLCPPPNVAPPISFHPFYQNLPVPPFYFFSDSIFVPLLPPVSFHLLPRFPFFPPHPLLSLTPLPPPHQFVLCSNI